MAGVIAHELGHIEQRHMLRRIAGHLGVITGTLALGVFIGLDAAVVVTRVNNIVALKYSRIDELAPDQRGADFLNRSGFAHQGMVSFFERLARLRKMESFL